MHPEIGCRRGGDHGDRREEATQDPADIAHHERDRDQDAAGGVEHEEAHHGRRRPQAGHRRGQVDARDLRSEHSGEDAEEPDRDDEAVRGAVLGEPSRSPCPAPGEAEHVLHAERGHDDEVAREEREESRPAVLGHGDEPQVREQEERPRHQRRPVVDGQPAPPGRLRAHRPEQHEVSGGGHQRYDVGVAERDQEGAEPVPRSPHVRAEQRKHAPQREVDGHEGGQHEQDGLHGPLRASLAGEARDGLGQHAPDERGDEGQRGSDQLERRGITHGALVDSP